MVKWLLFTAAFFIFAIHYASLTATGILVFSL